jgi:hypothetical protein
VWAAIAVLTLATLVLLAKAKLQKQYKTETQYLEIGSSCLGEINFVGQRNKRATPQKGGTSQYEQP